MIETIIVAVATVFGTVGIVYAWVAKNSGEAKKTPNENGVPEAKIKAQRIIIEAKDEAIKIKQEASKEAKRIRQKALTSEKDVNSRMNEVREKMRQAEERMKLARRLKEKWQKKSSSIDQLRRDQTDKLENIASLTKEEAKKQILENVEQTLQKEMARKIKEAEEKLQIGIDEKARELLIDVMQQASTDYVAEYTISTIKLLDEDVKGRIIGKEGRNIRAFENITGVNVDFDNGDVRLSSFDAVRREIARVSLEKLILDGRIQPARIESIVKRTTEEIEKIVLKEGEKLCHQVGVYNLPGELVQRLGHFKYRTSAGQNMIQHTLEETKMGVKIASEVNANVMVTKLACLLHDIGKVITDKEGSHADLGAEYLKKFNIPQEVIAAVKEHHLDKPTTLEGVIVQIADSISGARPGARYDDLERFAERVKAIENIALSFDGVDKAFAISAGRELRVIVKPDEISDSDAVLLSHKIGEKIEQEQTFPGTIKVIVIREKRAEFVAS